MGRVGRGTRALPVLVAAGLSVLALALLGIGRLARGWFADPLPLFRDQACDMPDSWLERVKRGHYGPRSGHISIVPQQPAYMASGAGGWSHSGPWPYLQRVPLVFYGPGRLDARRVSRPVTIADVAPTLASVLKGSFRADGQPLEEVAQLDREVLLQAPPKLVLVVVWDGGGWNTLRRWSDAWPNLARLIRDGVSYSSATVGSSPSVTPSVHTTLGTGAFPSNHGITGIPVRDERGKVVDSFLRGESSRFLRVPTLVERWDEQTGNRALIGMVGYEPWHLGMIGMGAERPGGDKDDAAWLDIETNEWITNPEHYRLPPALPRTGGLDRDLARLDAADGQVDGAWGDQAILEDRARVEETPAFIRYHARVLKNLIIEEGYGEDEVTDLLFTNFKQIDRVGHYFNMASVQVRDSLAESDRQLGAMTEFLDERIGPNDYLVVVTADHGQQPDASAIDGYGINPTELEADIKEEFGPVVRGVFPTEVFLYDDGLEERRVSIGDVAAFIADYRLEQNLAGSEGDGGTFDGEERLFEMAIPSRMLPELDC